MGGRLEVRFPADQEFLFPKVQTDPGAHEALMCNGYRKLFAPAQSG